MTIGYDKPLYVLPFDHRATFTKELFGWQEPLSPEQTLEIASIKRVIFDGLRAGVADGVPKDRAGILVDEQFGADILRDARKEGLVTACPAEKSGQDEFQFEYGPDYARHIEQYAPTFCKVLVRYNPGGDKAMNRRQAARLRQLSDYLHRSGRLFMFELLVPPQVSQQQRLGNDKHAYDLQLRPTLTVQAVQELQDSGVEANVWKIEGLERKEDCQRIVATARRAGRDKVGCIVLGRHEDEQTVRRWLLVAAGAPGFIGFAVGRTTFWDPLADYRRRRSHAIWRWRELPRPTGSGWTCSRMKRGNHGRKWLSSRRAGNDYDGQQCSIARPVDPGRRLCSFGRAGHRRRAGRSRPDSRGHFMHTMVPKIRRVREMIGRIKPDCDLEVDGGIDATTAPLVIEAGANVLVAGTSVFGSSEGVKAAMKRLRPPAGHLVTSGQT